MQLADDSSTIEPEDGRRSLGAPGVAGAPGSKGATLRWALIASVVFHLCLVVVLLAWYFPPRPSVARVVTADAPPAEPESLEQTNNGAEPSKKGEEQSEVKASGDLPAAPLAESSQGVPPDQIESSLQSAIESSTKISDDRKLGELQRNVQRLEQVASEGSIADIGQAVRLAAGLEQRSTMPASEAVEGGFDFDSAQFHDVTRQTDEKGNWVYRSVLLDAKGRTFEVDLTEAEGKTAYDTMQMVKASPFAEAIYRSMVMPMMDKMIPKVSPITNPSSGLRRPPVATESPVATEPTVQTEPREMP